MNTLRWCLEPLAAWLEPRVHVIYCQHNGHCFPLPWPETYEELVCLLAVELGYHDTDRVLVFEDASRVPVSVCSNATFSRLIPLTSGKRGRYRIYFVTLDLPGPARSAWR